MLHIFKEGKKGGPVFVLLHGTGGTEHDLIPLAEMLNSDYSILSIRGNVQEGGMNRYFKRHGEGQYDMEDLEFRGKELLNFIKESADKYDFNTEDAIPVGFSNGSNIAINIMLREESDIKKALLFAPLYPVDLSGNNKDLSGAEVFLSLGKGDPIVPEDESEKVVEIFKERGADVRHTWVNGHSLPQEVAMEARDWLNK
ncbi:alpha/beta hydrolase [Lacicoccus qingdaonensis]|uniref:Phospholipase/carboxylesterase n=1 Tax=Lacicoccus qingdaonensis TaxID=576118 RepID=A0A1G9H1C1_9BACL|nr:alpha/beta hydrolase [Salinicoccus qingdaonensis]SDL06697.1 phospholipase/carboxylesterase [Salinicoccus qingdaonensis]